MLIIAGHLEVAHDRRADYLRDCATVVADARRSTGCLDYSLAADPVDPGIIRVFERWETEDDLLAFRGAGPNDAQQAEILSADVKRFTISAIGDP